MSSRAFLLRFTVLLALFAGFIVPFTGPAAAAGPVMYPNGVGADLGPTPVTLGTAVRAGDDPAGLRTGTLAGKTYWQTQVSAGTGYLAVTADAGYVATLTGNAVVLVTYYDGGTGQLMLQTASGSTALATLSGTNTWKHAATAVIAADAGHELRLSGAESDITVAQIRFTAAGPSATLGPNPSNTGVNPNAGDNAAGLVTGTIAGRGYWQTDAASPPPSTNYFYMNVADSYAYNSKDILLVSIDYFDAGNGTLNVQYDSPGDELVDKFKPSPVFSYGDSGTWKTHDLVLDDAILTNRTNGSDFRITHDGSNVEIKVAAVRVTVIPIQLAPKAGLRALVSQGNRALYAAREGTRDGQYPAGAKATFAAVVADAQAVIDDPAATEAQVRAELQRLFDAYQAFRASAVNTNIARQATLSASSGANPGRANDGDGGTAWTSSGGAGEWLQADLGKVQPVNDVLVQWGQAYSPDYTVQTSGDGTHFTTVGRNGAPGGSSNSRTRFAVTPARFVRIQLSGAAGYTIAELQIRNQWTTTAKPVLGKPKFPTDDAVVADFVATAYGADPRGVKDSTKAIQNALYDCYDSGGGTVWLPDGTYRVTTTVEVPAFCTLRGDHRDPDRGSGSYGTVVTADLPSGDKGPVLFRIGGSASIIGVTTYYPRQSASAPVPYGFTFEITGSAWASDENYMMGTISDVTMLNSYRGIGISTMRDERGRPPAVGQTHESATVRNVKGTALLEGAEAYNGADVGTWENVRFSNAYWATAPAAYRPPARSTLDSWTRAHGTGFVLGDLEWEQFTGISASDYHIGIHIVPGQRVDFAGSFQQAQINRTDIALQVERFDSRWGLGIASSELDGDIVNNSAGFVKLTDTKLTGTTTGTVYRLAGKPPVYQAQPVVRQPTRQVLYDGGKVAHGNGYEPAADATAAIQQLLDRAGREGGGVVYLPAGWYRLAGRLVVPSNVELRGASSNPNRDQDGRSGGTVLFTYAGRNAPDADTAPAAITLAGTNSGVSGLRFFYPENNPATGLVPYPYAIRGDGFGAYVVNVGLPNGWNAVDMSSARANLFLVRKLSGTFVRHGVTVGKNTGGRIEGVLTNGNTFVRVGFHEPGWVLGSNLFPQVIDGYTRKYEDLVTVNGASRLTVLNAFGYGLHNGLVVNSGDVRAYNLGSDNLGTGGVTVKADAGQVSVVNLMRYNGATSTGTARLFNIMVINIVQSKVAVTATDGGTATLAGNETLPGSYENGSQVTATARPATGFRFVNWTSADTVVSTDPAYAFTVAADTNLVAHFAKS